MRAHGARYSLLTGVSSLLRVALSRSLPILQRERRLREHNAAAAASALPQECALSGASASAHALEYLSDPSLVAAASRGVGETRSGNTAGNESASAHLESVSSSVTRSSATGGHHRDAPGLLPASTPATPDSDEPTNCGATDCGAAVTHSSSGTDCSLIFDVSGAVHRVWYVGHPSINSLILLSLCSEQIVDVSPDSSSPPCLRSRRRPGAAEFARSSAGASRNSLRRR